MRFRSPAVVVATLPVALALFAGCTGQADEPSEHSALAPAVTASPALAEPCLVVAEGPGLPAWEINEALPIDRVDVAHSQRELLVEAGGGPCDADPASYADPTGDADPAGPSPGPCRMVSGPYEQVRDVHIWRQTEAFLEQEVGSGALRVLSVNVNGYTVDGEGFHWRAIAIEYGSPAAATASPAWVAINACDDLRSEEIQTGVVSLHEGDEPFLAATVDGTTVYVVETWVASDEDRLTETRTGLPPADAVSMLLVWLKDQMRHA